MLDPDVEVKILKTAKIKIKTNTATATKIATFGNVFLGGGGTIGGMLSETCATTGIVYVFEGF
jgi:hypothetical protein